MSCVVYIISLRITVSAAKLYYPGIVTVRHKADILTVWFGGIYKTIGISDITNFRLYVSAERKLCSLKLLLSHGVEYITLVLALVKCLLKQESSVGSFLYPCIMTCYDIITVKYLGTIKQLVKLHVPVAVYAGIGCDTRLIAADEFIDDLFIKVI